ncbi:uncharacterized protein BYT42DRAFT_573760 [Radiomyces spectabilis]|uniref:uncharacterized protein n=1 Tax=Radiomyces spectabilis TaxID=64574 RepID=UPI00221EFC77|nr:uncharacterized protein BYT42DRAFT_573760 [Radiomyces spectabilis]KAI8376206.1 hypothetical protein BYT42DRAFT_573760 [Radiomyces spectabilis]
MFNHLPDEIVLHVLNYSQTDLVTLCSLATVSRRFRRLVCSILQCTVLPAIHLTTSMDQEGHGCATGSYYFSHLDPVSLQTTFTVATLSPRRYVCDSSMQAPRLRRLAMIDTRSNPTWSLRCSADTRPCRDNDDGDDKDKKRRLEIVKAWVTRSTRGRSSLRPPHSENSVWFPCQPLKLKKPGVQVLHVSQRSLLKREAQWSFVYHVGLMDTKWRCDQPPPPSPRPAATSRERLTAQYIIPLSIIINLTVLSQMQHPPQAAPRTQRILQWVSAQWPVIQRPRPCS